MPPKTAGTPGESLRWSRLCLEDRSPWKGPMPEKFVKNCCPQKGCMPEKFIEDCLPWEGPPGGAGAE